MQSASFSHQDWSEDSEDEEQQPLSREDSGIQVDRTPLEEPDQSRKLGSRVSWKGSSGCPAPVFSNRNSLEGGAGCEAVLCFKILASSF